MQTIDALDSTLRSYLNPEQTSHVKRAYFFAEQAHFGQVRRSGEDYVTHPLAVAGILADMHMDHQSLMAAMLHDVIEDTGINKAAISDNVFNVLKTTSDQDVSMRRVEFVGPQIGDELRDDGGIALLVALGGILIYISIRFQLKSAVGAILALVHDVIITIGIFSLVQLEFNLSIIAAILTIIGYSINDTVVIFDRLRENLIKYKTRPLRDVMNLSVNETLSRTLMTSGTTLLALIALLVLGGDVIRGFVFAITWGVIVGTYSSVYVAKNVVLFLGVKRDWSKPDSGSGGGGAGTQFANIDA